MVGMLLELFIAHKTGKDATVFEIASFYSD